MLRVYTNGPVQSWERATHFGWSHFSIYLRLSMRAALNEEARGPASTNVPCPPQMGPRYVNCASPWYVNCAGFELNCAGFDFLPISAYHDLSFCCIDLPQFDNVGQNRMHTFAGDVDGMRRTVAIVHTDAFDDEDTQGLVLVQINSVHEMMLEPVGSYLLVKWDQGIKALADCRAPTNAVNSTAGLFACVLGVDDAGENFVLNYLKEYRSLGVPFTGFTTSGERGQPIPTQTFARMLQQTTILSMGRR